MKLNIPGAGISAEAMAAQAQAIAETSRSRSMTCRVFLSSTSRDLAEYREAVHRAIDGLPGFQLVKMEDFGARDASAKDLCTRLVRDCDLFVGLMGHYYGSCPPNEPVSFTELEYRTARAANLPRLMFVAPDDFAIPASLRESDASFERQQALRREVMSDLVVAAFDTPEKLAGAVTRALFVWHEDQRRAQEATIDSEVTRQAPLGAGAKMPPAPRVAVAKLREEQIQIWIGQMLAAQEPETGGLKTHFDDPASPPQVWATAQCLTGILRTLLSFDYRNQIDGSLVGYRNQIRNAFDFIEQNRLRGDGEGWSYTLGARAEAVTEITCWVTLARLYGLRTGFLWPEQRALPVVEFIRRDLHWIMTRQHEGGGWCPVQHLSQKNTRTYSTVMALWTLLEASQTPCVTSDPAVEAAIHDGLRWLLNERSERFGWVPNPGRRRQRAECLGVEAQVLAILMLGRQESNGPVQVLLRDSVIEKAKQRFLEHEDLQSRRVLLNDTLQDADQWLESTAFLLEGSSFLWAPWSVLALDQLSRDRGLPAESKERARQIMVEVIARLFSQHQELGINGTYELAEIVFCLSSVFWKNDVR